MYKFLLSLFLTLNLISCSSTSKVNYEQEKSKYKRAAINLVSVINSKNVSKNR